MTTATRLPMATAIAPLSAALCVLLCLGAMTVVRAQQSGATPARPAASAGSDLHVLPVQRNVYMLTGPRGNSAVQIGPDGVLLVDTQEAQLAPQVFAAIRTLTDKPIHTIINTSVHAEHVAGNDALIKLGSGGVQPIRVIAHENVLHRLLAAPAASLAAGQRLNQVITLPINSEYFTPTRDFFLNGEAIVLYHAAAAHTDGDTLVFFRGSDVVSTGDLFRPDLYPFIDVQNGGSVNGEIAALNRILELTVPAKFQEGGTYVIPGHGRLCDEAEVVEYRDMVTIIRDRVRDLIKKGMTLAQVKSARPSRDYDSEYGAQTGAWTTDMFVEATYASLTKVEK
jgi:glyoxylase-like metal-dependent hydrolase (beta-lactamase superfamily II)